MRDKTHQEQIVRWAEYVRNNPGWKKKLKPFIDGQIIMARRFYKRLAKTQGGKEKIKEIRKMRAEKRN